MNLKQSMLIFLLCRGLKATDGAPDVKKAYRKAALRHHPDKVSQQWKAIAESIQMDADRLFKMIGEAYAVLSDSTKVWFLFLNRAHFFSFLILVNV